MISVAAAKKIIQEQITALPPVELPLQEVAGLVLAKDVHAKIDIPAFNQSSVDGYAFLYEGWKGAHSLELAGEMAAGDHTPLPILPHQAIRIFTGAAVPDAADTVVMQEKTWVHEGKLTIEDPLVLMGSNVRPKGSEIKAGALALGKGSLLSPAAIGFLAGIGVDKVMVYAKPRVSVIVTGNELQTPGQPLAFGQVYESNSFTLSAVLGQVGIGQVNLFWAKDNLEEIILVLQNALEHSDMVLLTGGISVGDYDFVLDAATRCGVEKQFHGVKQRPGKPLYFGLKNKQPVFGLPGNPSSVLTCVYEYVLPALQLLSPSVKGLTTTEATLSGAVDKPNGLTHFMKGHYNGNTVTALGAQESYRLSSFATANCLIALEENKMHLAEGTLVEVHLLP